MVSGKRKSSGLLQSELDSLCTEEKEATKTGEKNGWIGAAQLVFLRTHFGKQKTKQEKKQQANPKRKESISPKLL